MYMYIYIYICFSFFFTDTGMSHLVVYERRFGQSLAVLIVSVGRVRDDVGVSCGVCNVVWVSLNVMFVCNRVNIKHGFGHELKLSV